VNIVLIGMPGCGKSTIGPLLGRPFYDADAEIERTEHRTIVDVFATDGEAYFRRVEHETVRRLSALDGVTIATGGGVVKDPKNMAVLKRHGWLVFLHRPPELVTTDNAERPLLRGHGPQRPSGVAAVNDEAPSPLSPWALLYRERLPLYRQYADIEVLNDGAPEECAARILEGMSTL